MIFFIGLLFYKCSYKCNNYQQKERIKVINLIEFLNKFCMYYSIYQ